MKQNKWVKTVAVIVLFVLAALPQFIIYYRGYYYYTDASASLKYSLNTGCFLGVAAIGYWYLKQAGVSLLYKAWLLIYTLGGLFIAGEYFYHFLYRGWGTQTYLNTMGLFEGLVSPLPFLIAWLLLRVIRYAGQQPRA